MIYDDNLTVQGELTEGIRVSIACNEFSLRQMMEKHHIQSLHFRTKDTWREEDKDLQGVVMVKSKPGFNSFAHNEEIEQLQVEIKKLTRYTFRVQLSQNRGTDLELS